MFKILVIEDDDIILDNVCTILSQAKFEVISAANGLVGLQKAQSELPDLILSDVMMPLLDGYGVLEKLRQDPATAMIPLIFLTAKDDRASVRQGMDLGADDYLPKPFTSAELRNAVNARLNKQTLLKQQYQENQEQVQSLQKQVEKSQGLLDAQEDLLTQLSQELRNPLSNINMAVRMLEKAETEAERDRYLHVLKEECAREISLLNQIDKLQEFLLPSNAKTLRRFQVIKTK